MTTTNKLQSILCSGLLAAVLALVAAGCKCPCMKNGDSAVSTAEAAKAYPLETCLMSGEELGASPVSTVYQGQEVKFCCKDCMEEFQKDPAKHLAKLNSAN